MTDNFSPDSLPEEHPPTGKFDKNEGVSESEVNNLDKEFEQLINGLQTGNVEKFLESLKAAAVVYIDQRQIGNYLEQDARIYGSVAGRDLRNNATDSTGKEIAGQVVVKNIDKVRSVYVRTANYGYAQQILKDKHLLILWGEQNHGKQTTAIHLLLSLPTDEILEINPAIEDLSLLEFNDRQAYIIDSLASDSAGKLNSYVMNFLIQKLRTQNSYLVITIDSHTSIARQELGGYFLHWNNEFPQTYLLLEKHLAWYLKNQAVLANQHGLTQADSVRKLLTNNLLPGQVDQLAALLAKAVRAELTLEEAIERFSLLADDHVEHWFDKNPDLAQGVFMISLAVLNGCKYQTVFDASQRLQSLIQPLQQKEVLNSELVFSTKRKQRLKDVCAHLVQGYENTEFRRNAVNFVELDNPAFQPAVLSHIWQEYDTLRQPLLRWLQELGSDRNLDVRIKAAAAVGELSKYDFGFIREQVLLPWAKCKEKQLQKLAALALSIPIFEGELAPQVLGLLHYWSTVDNTYLRWTAATAYGGYVGLRFPSTALSDLLAIAQSENSRLLPVVVESVVNIFETGRVFSVLKALQMWSSHPPQTLPHQLSLFIFWMLMRSTKVAKKSNSSALLELAIENQDQDKDRVYENLLICLLQRSLNIKYLKLINNFRLRDHVEQEIYNWLKQIDEDPEHRLYPAIGPIIFTLAHQGTELEEGRIVAKLERWKSHEKSNAASKILTKIKKYKKHLNF